MSLFFVYIIICVSILFSLPWPWLYVLPFNKYLHVFSAASIGNANTNSEGQGHISFDELRNEREDNHSIQQLDLDSLIVMKDANASICHDIVSRC